MKKLFILFLFCFSTTMLAQQNEKLWSKVIDCENEGKIKSANEIVNKIYENAKSRNNETQIIKCFFYKSKYIQVLDELPKTKIIDNLQIEIKQATTTSRAILNLIYVKMLNDYHKDYRNNIYHRTKTDSKSTDFLTWTNADFETEIEAIYAQTLENEATLLQTKLIDYEPIFDFLSIDKFKNENLLDYVLQENLAFYKSKIN